MDITSIGSVIKTDIAQIRMLFIEKTTDLNSEIFHEQTAYNILPKFGPQGGYLRRLSSEIRECKFCKVEMIRN